MSLPTLAVEVGFTSTPATAQASIVWTAITDFVRSGDIKRGRSSELDTFQAGTCRLVLNNSDRRFDPNHTPSPYSPNVLPMRPVRVRATHNAVTYTLFTGYVTGWPQDYSPPNYAETVIDCVDGFEVLRQAQLPESVWAHEVAADDPQVWLRLGEQSGTTCVDSSGNGNHGEYQGGATFNSRTGLIAKSADKAIGFDGVDDAAFFFPVGTMPSAFPVTLECWVDVLVADVGLVTPIFGSYSPDEVLAERVSLELGSTGTNKAILRATSQTVLSTNTITGGLHHLVGVASSAAANMRIWVDGVDVSAANVTPGGAIPANQRLFITNLPGFPFVEGAVDECVAYASALSSARIAAHYAAGTDPWAGDDSGARVGRLLDAVGWPAADRTVATGVSTLGPATLNTDALSALKNAELAEAGLLHMAADGKVVFRNRHHRLTTTTSTTSQATFGDAGGAEFPYFHQGFHLRYDRDLIRNVVTGRRTGGPSITAEDATSKTSYGRRALDLGALDIKDDAQVTDRVAYTVDLYKEPLQRVEQITVKPDSQPGSGDTWTSNGLWAAVLAADISNRFTVKRRPQNIGSAISLAVLVEGVEHRFEPGDWTTQFYLSPADTRQYWILGTSELGTDTRLGY